MEQNRRRKASNGTRPARPTTSPRTTNPAKATKPTKSTKAVKSAKSPTPPAKPRKPSGPRKYRKTVWLPIGRTSVRIRVFMVIVGVLLGTAGLRAIQVQGIDSTAMADEAAKKMQSSRDLPAARGDIVDRNGVTLATTEPAMIVSIDPDMIRTNGADKRYQMSKKKQEETEAAPEAVADLLVKHLGGKKQTYLDLIATPDSRYEIVAKKVPAYVFTQLKADLAKGIDGDGKRPWWGVFGHTDPIRTYPNRTVAANVIGFVNHEGKGASGLEYALDDQLNGTPGKMVYDYSTYGRIPLGTNVMTPAEDGTKYELTIDSDLQWISEQLLADGIRQSGAKTGKAVVMDVHSGEVLAMANGPSFDPSNPGAADEKDWGNRIVTENYEPGSVQKVLTMAALTDAGLATPDTKVEVPARIASGGGYVRDSFEHGTLQLTARGVVAQSSNIGTIQLSRQMPKADLSKYLSSFGLGEKPNSGLPGESKGSLPGADMADYTRDQISFGQGLSVNALQMTAAVAAVVNGGTYHQPSIIKSATKADGTPIDMPQKVSRRVISEEASDMTVEMMESVITMREDRSIPGYRTAGKSGTAQRYDPKCKCYNGFTASFVGVAPAEDPQIVVYVVLDQPTNGNLGSQLALPVVNNILSMALPRYNVAPSTTDAPDGPLTYS
ncbi:MAG TPA: penicillin-binding protein 2 [Tessaracoccus flavescens]|uniref:Penicillin-binding protein 2 n=1 Tax=Tessaracoccus flavescens TaxID=399497 RepID=A0A921ERR4_9ACTN|nr:penicillin-binding protein 2 [Tessaracoccus flavescens]